MQEDEIDYFRDNLPELVGRAPDMVHGADTIGKLLACQAAHAIRLQVS